MSTSNMSTADTVAVSTTSLVYVNTSNVMKLSSTNFLMWSRQIHALFDGYDLANYLDGTVPVPPETISATDGTPPTANPAFGLWRRQDKLVYSALLGAISASVHPIVSRAATAHEIWSTLNTTYAKPSRGHILQLQNQVTQWMKGTGSIDDYVQGLVALYDKLALLGKVVDHDDQLAKLLKGLPDDYQQVVNQIEGRETTPSLPEVHEKLILHEANLLASTSATALPITANAASYNRNSNNRGYHSNNSGGHSNARSNQPCARRCSQFQLNSQFHATPYAPWKPRANLVTAPNVTPWVVDSGATHNLTTDLNNLALHQPYHGSDGVTIADGSTIPISHSGSTSLPTASRPLHLKDV
ncbi:PREDICTED: uncharacterized protein LOC109127384 [Camelina sativa]|uniref:Uncharacterized protein LOC109127384 n=1 Tax=Camelina sativa TaxID=90675 RepID=A0ABM1QLC1_CAMSA|nr:PREDICTED: uncharacterized protein LOC109127384 [Camelina sativa]